MPARHLQGEIMDDPALDAREHRLALAGLARINTLSRAAEPIWQAMQSLCVPRAEPGRTRPVRVLDVGTGSGDVMLALHRRAARNAMSLDLTLCDVSPVALDAACARLHAANAQARPLAADVLRGVPLPDRSVDVACCSLLLHHLTRDDARRLLAEMARVAGTGIVALDLRRCRAGLAAARVIPRLVTRSRIVHVDAVRSVRAAWTRDELLDLAACAGLGGATVKRAWPWRMTLIWRRPDEAKQGTHA